MKTTSDGENYDLLLVGAGIMSATLATLVSRADPSLRIAVIERLDWSGQEASAARHNAGTGHAGLCELNYTPRKPDGSISTEKAREVNGQFGQSLSFWAELVRKGMLDPSFIQSRPHMSFVTGPDVEFLRDRHEALSRVEGFSRMEYSEDPEQIRSWAPLLMDHRDPSIPVAATWDPSGTDVDFGSLTEQLLEASGADVYYSASVKSIRRRGGEWTVRVKSGNSRLRLTAPKVFIGAGGGTLPLLQRARVREVRGYGGFPISGRFWTTPSPGAVAAHRVKVYGLAGEGAPPMSVPHLDARSIGGEESILFGPFAGWSPRFLKTGHLWDLFLSLRWRNLLPQLSVALANPGLLKYLVGEVFAGDAKKLAEVRKFYPQAEAQDWSEVVAGQRVQVIKPLSRFRGSLQFGTEVIVSADGSIGGLLGASPGASTAVSIMGETLSSLMPELDQAVPNLTDGDAREILGLE